MLTNEMKIEAQRMLADITTKLILAGKLPKDFLVKKGFGTMEQIKDLIKIAEASDAIRFNYGLEPQPHQPAATQIAKLVQEQEQDVKQNHLTII